MPGPPTPATDSGGGPAPRRVRVTSPRRDARARNERRSGAVELTEQTGLGEVYLNALLKAQLRLAAIVLLGVFALVGVVPAIFLFVPEVATLMVGPVPVMWLAVGVALYPLVLLVARVHVRQAERIEREFAELMAGH